MIPHLCILMESLGTAERPLLTGSDVDGKGAEKRVKVFVVRELKRVLKKPWMEEKDTGKGAVVFWS